MSATADKKRRDELDEHGPGRALGVANINNHWNPAVVNDGLCVCECGSRRKGESTYAAQLDELEDAFL